MKEIELQNNKYLTEQINENNVEEWIDNKVVLDCPTGMGKTTLINEVVSRVAGKENGRVLFLSSRTALTEQQLHNLKQLGVNNMEVKTYQWLEQRLRHGSEQQKAFLQQHYDFIVADECHYFTNDATFNDNTAISYKWIEEQPTVIYMSATGETIFKYMTDKEKVDLYYYSNRDYSKVSTITFCHSDEHMIECVEDIYNSGEKGIIFIDKLVRDGELGTKVHSPLMQWYLDNREDCHFICSSHRKDFKTINEFDTAIANGKFEKQLLFTTQALEVGIDIKDPECKHIMVEMFDVDSVIQALGRIRNKDGVHYYIRVYDKRTLSGKANTLKNNKLNKINDFKQLGTLEERYSFCSNGKGNFTSYDGLFYIDILGDRDIKINELMAYKYEDIYKQYISAINCPGGGKYSDHPHVDRWMDDFTYFGFKGQFIDMGLRDEENGTNELKAYLESLVDIKLDKEQQKELIEKLNVRVDGKQKKTVKPINAWLMENGFNYVITSKLFSINGKKETRWVVACIE